MNTEIKAIKITESVYWVGAIDWTLHDFHGYQTTYGSTYNAYLILGREPILIDTVKAHFWDEMVARIRSVIDPAEIQYIISNHAELDHSGCLIPAIELMQPKKIFTSSVGVAALIGNCPALTAYNELFEVIPYDEPLVLGDKRFLFIEARMLHWPESMFTYLLDDAILFSQDAFGMHLATDRLFVADHPFSLCRQEAAKYYANIILPHSSSVLKLLQHLPMLFEQSHTVPQFIAPDHGPIWQGSALIQQIFALWQQWAEQRLGPKIIIVYDTMWQSTAKMAEAIARGALSVHHNELIVKLMPLANHHRSNIMTELLEAGALVLGSPTLNQQLFPTMADFFTYFRGLQRKNLIGQVFGSYGWAPAATKILAHSLQELQIETIAEPIAVKYLPTSEILEQCYQTGKAIAERLMIKLEEERAN